MRAVDIIIKKRDGGELSREEIEYFIRGFQSGEVPDYQISAWAMAVLFNGMNARETADLTRAMAESGDQLDLSDVVECSVDKHSTGGVGDKTTLVVAPIVSACCVPVGKMSGRGLGFTGGTLDKMESIDGFCVDLTADQFKQQLKSIGIVLSGQTADLAPADGALYALRDVTGTIPSIPLIASSVMSKKIAGGADAVVLDVKTGVGAFMQTFEKARELARMMVDIGEHAGRKVVALISDMNQPLGLTVGNALEVREAIETLKGGGPADLREHCLVVAAHMVHLAGEAETLDQARAQVEASLDNGKGFEKFKQLVEAQDGDIRMVDDPDLLPRAPFIQTIKAPRSGYIAEINAREVGLTAMGLGAGRQHKGESVDHGVGIVLHHKVGEPVEKDDGLYTIHSRSQESFHQAAERLLQATKISPDPVEELPLIYETITE
ncbi:MAG: pyrimidine-nucleoside phosphorylase [Anaerolineales bacterium]